MSSAIDDETKETLAAGRRTAGAMLRSAQKDLQKVFIVFVVGFLGTFYLLRLAVWDFLKSVTKARLNAQTAGEVNIIAQTPFDVILLQAKIGLIVGIIVALPALLYFSRGALQRRGYWPQSPVARWKLAGIGTLSASLFVLGVLYGYSLFFPFMFAFLANNALSAGIQPTYSIVKWAQFIALLTFSFGFAAQMPLLVTALSYAGIVPYETFREKWRHAIAGIFVFGAFFSPPDPFTQVMWAVPLIVLYGASLYLAKVVVTAKRGGDDLDLPAIVRGEWNRIAAVGVAVGGGLYLAFASGAVARLNAVLAREAGRTIPVPGDTVLAIIAVAAGVVASLIALAGFVYRDLLAAVETDTGDPAEIDLAELDADGVQAAPVEAFEQLEEEEALAAAQAAIDDGDKPKAQAILDRFDEASEDADDATAAGEPSASDAPPRDLFAAEVGLAGAIARGRELVDWRTRARGLWNVLAGVAVAVFGAGYALVERPEATSEVLAVVGLSRPDVPALLSISPTATLGLFAGVGVGVALLLGVGIGLYAAYLAGTDPTAVDLPALSVEQLQRAPDTTFRALSERRVRFLANEASEAGDPQWARTLLDRFDAAETPDPSAGPDAADLPGVADDAGDRASRAGGAFLEDLTDGERDEDDVGGYYDDVVAVLDSMKSGLFWIVAVFGLTLVSVFAWLYSGGIGDLRQDFVSRLPEAVVGEGAAQFGVIALHPVEALIFEVKFSTLLGVVAALPFIAYYAWPALRNRGFVRGRRGVIFGWTAVLLVGLVAGFAFGYTTFAPELISWLVADVLQADGVVSYRLKNFFWLIILTTVGIGFLVDVPVFMILLNTAGISYSAMRNRWREVTLGVLIVAALFTPADIVTMFLVTIPIMFMYGIGLLALFVLTLGGRRNLSKPTSVADEGIIRSDAD